jgi:hypothetical protein
MNLTNFGVLICRIFNITCIEKKMIARIGTLYSNIYKKKPHSFCNCFVFFALAFLKPEMVKMSVFGFLVTKCRKKIC